MCRILITIYKIMIKIISSTIITLCILSSISFAQDKQDDIVAVWDAGETKVEIYKVDEKYIGNPINTEGERNSEIEILNLEYKKGKWVGKIYSKRRNKLFDAECEVEGDVLFVKVDAGLRTRKFEWSKVK